MVQLTKQKKKKKEEEEIHRFLLGVRKIIHLPLLA